MNCDPIARWYRTFEYLTFGRALERRRFEFIEEVSDARRVLILGDGDGRFTAKFVKRNANAQIDSVDLSARMIELAKQRAGAGVRYWVGDARTISLEDTYDLVVTHFFLDCLADVELDRLITRIAARCEPGARWLISEFALPAGGLGRMAARGLIRFMYFCFSVTTGLDLTQLPDYAQAMDRHGFTLLRKRTALGGLLVSEIRSLRS